MNGILLGMVGDLLIDRDEPDEALAEVGELLGAPDVLFGNLEAVFTEDPQMAPSVGVGLFPGAHNLDAFARAGFDVVSLANNHIVDAGHRAMLENRDRLRALGVETCGAGRDIRDARRPAIVRRGDLTIAFLAYASVFPMGYEARSTVPGLAPLRAHDLWRPAYDNYQIPGTPPQIRSIPDEADLAALADDIARAREVADVVVASFHWGDFLVPFHLTDHERRTARWCVDQGVDLVVGHHHHALRGMEWYRGKPIMYGLGHFVFDSRPHLSEEQRVGVLGSNADPDGYAIFPREGWPLLPMHPDTRLTLLAWASAGPGGIGEIGFVPCRLRPDGRVVAVDPDTAEGREVVEYVRRGMTTQGLAGEIVEDSAPTLGGHRSVRVVAPGG